MIYHSESKQQTQAIARMIAKKLRGGEVIGLIGSLGSGKTTFIQGLAKGLGCASIVNSPTFIVMNIYNLPARRSLKKPKFLIHVDAFRLKSGDREFFLALDEYLHHDDSVVVVEWADRIKEKINYTFLVKMGYRGQKERHIEIISHF